MNQLTPHIVSAFTGPDHCCDPAAVQLLATEAPVALKLPADFIRAGDRAVLKPNRVKKHNERHPGPEQWEHVMPHPVIIEAVLRGAAQP